MKKLLRRQRLWLAVLLPAIALLVISGYFLTIRSHKDPAPVPRPPLNYSYNKPVEFPESSVSNTSPDKQKQLIFEGESSFIGASSQNVLVKNTKSGTTQQVVAISEADPGSGITASFAWSNDSKQLFITGTLYGNKDFYYVYDTEMAALYDIR